MYLIEPLVHLIKFLIPEKRKQALLCKVVYNCPFSMAMELISHFDYLQVLTSSSFMTVQGKILCQVVKHGSS